MLCSMRPTRVDFPRLQVVYNREMEKTSGPHRGQRYGLYGPCLLLMYVLGQVVAHPRTSAPHLLHMQIAQPTLLVPHWPKEFAAVKLLCRL